MTSQRENCCVVASQRENCDFTERKLRLHREKVAALIGRDGRRLQTVQRLQQTTANLAEAAIDDGESTSRRSTEAFPLR